MMVRMGDRPVGELIEELAARLGRPEFTRVCVALLEGAPREDHLDSLPWLTGHDWSEGEPVRDAGTWHDYWVRTWGARGLLHVWDDAATDAVVKGLADEHWRPAEMGHLRSPRPRRSPRASVPRPRSWLQRPRQRVRRP